MSQVVTTAERIAAHFRDQIASGELKPGDRLPTRQAIAEEWSVARQTAGNGIGILVSEGLVETGGRAGTVVVDPQRPSAVTIVLDGVPAAAVRDVRPLEVSDDLAKELGVPAGSSLLVVRFQS